MTSHSNFRATDNDRAVAGTVATVGDGVGNGAVAAVTVTNPNDAIIATNATTHKSSFPRKRESRTNNPAQPTEFDAAAAVTVTTVGGIGNGAAVTDNTTTPPTDTPTDPNRAVSDIIVTVANSPCTK